MWHSLKLESFKKKKKKIIKEILVYFHHFQGRSHKNLYCRDDDDDDDDGGENLNLNWNWDPWWSFELLLVVDHDETYYSWTYHSRASIDN